MNGSVCSDFQGGDGLMSTTNAGYMKTMTNRFGVNQNRPMTMRGRGSGGFFSHTLKPLRDDA